MPTIEEIYTLKKKKGSSSDLSILGIPENPDFDKEEADTDQIPKGKALTESVDALIKETEPRPTSLDVHSRRILPSDRLTIHVDSQNPLPSKEKMVHQDDLETYKKEAFEKNTLDLKKVREELQKIGGGPKKSEDEIKAEKLAALEKEERELDRKMAETDKMSYQEIAEIAGAKKGNELEFGRKDAKRKEPINDPWRKDSEAYDRIVINSKAKKDRREYDPETGAVLKDLDKLTDSESILDHHKAAELIRGLTLEQKEKVKKEASPKLMEKLNNIEAPEFGRKEARRKEPINDPWRKDSEAYDRIVVPSDRKKALRGYDETAVAAKKPEDEEISVVPPVKKKATEYIYDKDFVAKKAKAAEEAKGKQNVIHLPYIETRATAPVENYLTPEQAREIDAIADEIRKKKVAEVAAAPGFANSYANQKTSNGNPDNLPPEVLKSIRRSNEEGGERKRKNETFWQKAGSVLKNPEVQLQLLKTGISIPASVLGYKSLYDVPAYLAQRYAVRGNVFGIGKGKGLEGSVEELLEASQLHKKAKDNKGETTPGLITKAIKDLDKRLAKTKEGSEKNSEQRNKIAKLLWENRHQENQTGVERGKELENILDNYTTTKVSGIQAAREALNTACVATGAFTLRGVAYGSLAFFESYEKMRREKRIEAQDKGPEAKAEDVKIREVFARGLQETWDGIRGKSGKNKWQKSIGAIKSAGSIARLVGIAIGMGGGGQAYGASLDKVIDTIEAKDKLAAVGNNFINNTDKYLNLVPGVGAGLADTLNQFGQEAVDSLAQQEPLAAAPSYNPTAKFDFAAAPAQVSSMTGEEIPEASFQGGKSVWQEGDKQLLARFGEKFAHLDKAAREVNIARLQNAIVANPEAFGLPKDIDFNRMQLADLENIKWNDAFNNVFGDKKGLTEVVHNLDKTLAHPDENLVRFNGSAEPSGPELEAGSADRAIKYIDNQGMKAHLAELSEKARKFYDPATGQIEKRKIFEELSTARENIDRATGGKSSFGLDGDINLKLANGETMNIFDNPGAPLIDIAKGFSPAEELPAAEERLTSRPFRPSLGYNPLDPHHEGDLAHHGASDLAAEETSSHSASEAEALPDVGDPREMRESITDAGVAKALLHNAEHPRNINVHQAGGVNLDLRHVENISNEALKVWQNKPGVYNLYGLKHINQEAYDILSQYKGKVIFNDEVAKQFETFNRQKPEYAEWFKGENLEHAVKPAEAVPAEAANHAEAVSHVNAVPENIAAPGEVAPAVFAERMKNDPFGDLPKVNPSFAEKYTDFQRENLTNYINTEIEERNELLKILGDYEKTYGNRPQFGAFRNLVGERLMAENLTIAKMINGVKDPAQNIEATVQSIGQGGPRAMAESVADIFASKAKLISSDEMADKAFAELDNRK